MTSGLGDGVALGLTSALGLLGGGGQRPRKAPGFD